MNELLIDNEINLESSELFLAEDSGVYIPKMFAEAIKPECLSGVSEEDLKVLREFNLHQDSELYWNTWDYVLLNALITNPSTDIEYNLHHDGDLWLVPLDS